MRQIITTLKTELTIESTIVMNQYILLILQKKFKKEGHKLTLDFETSRNIDDDSSKITNYIIGQESDISKESTKNYQTQNKNLLQTDYIFPINKNSQFEAGYKGDFNALLTDYSVETIDNNGAIKIAFS